MKYSILKIDLREAISLLKPAVFRRSVDWFGIRPMLKICEIKLLRKFASTYCAYMPNTIFVEIANTCQLRCIYCFRKNDDLKNPHEGMMPFERFVQVADQFKGIKQFNLFGGGEALLHKDYLRMLRYLRDNKISTQISTFTNGVSMTPDLIDEMLSIGIDNIGISFDSPEPEINDSIRIGGRLNKILENVRYLASHAGPETRIEVISVLSNNNIESVQNMPELLHDLGIRHFRTQNMVIRSVEAKNLRPNNPLKMKKYLKKKCRQYGISYQYYSMHPKTTCLDPFYRLLITWDGKVSPCCTIKTIGLNEEPYEFSSTWNGSAMQKWRKNILCHTYLDICKINCDILHEKRLLDI